MATTAQFIATPRIDTVNISTANTNLDGTGTVTTLTTGASTGTRILEIVVKSAATSAAAQVGIFLSTDSGSTWRLFDQIAPTAITASNTTATFRLSRSYANLVLKDATHRLGVTTTIQQSTNVIALGGDL